MGAIQNMLILKLHLQRHMVGEVPTLSSSFAHRLHIEQDFSYVIGEDKQTIHYP